MSNNLANKISVTVQLGSLWPKSLYYLGLLFIKKPDVSFWLQFRTNRLVIFLFFLSSSISCHRLFCLLPVQPGVFLTAKAKGQLHAQRCSFLPFHLYGWRGKSLIRAGEGKRQLDNWNSLPVKALPRKAGATVQSTEIRGHLSSCVVAQALQQVESALLG